jgi:hypothetical protein
LKGHTVYRTRSFLSSLAVAVCLAASSIVTYASDAISELRNWVLTRIDAAVLHVAAVFHQPSLEKPRAKFAQARAFVARLLKRERPHIESSWRMCPSV